MPPEEPGAPTRVDASTVRVPRPGPAPGPSDSDPARNADPPYLAHVVSVVDAAPPLSVRQREHLRMIFSARPRKPDTAPERPSGDPAAPPGGDPA